jgi:DNA-binding response OmpR family regulator
MSGRCSHHTPVLLIESDPSAGRAIAQQLTADGYAVQLARSAQHARSLARASVIKIALLGNVETSHGAVHLLEEMRACANGEGAWDPELAAIVIGSQADEFEVLRAFEAGADDYLARPARYLELRARLHALLRRCDNVPPQRGTFEVGPLRINPSGYAATLNDEPVSLRRLEFELLVHLARDPERVFTRDELLRAVWGYRCSGTTRTVDSHASRLRRKLDRDGARRWVISVWGVGYRLR